MEPQRGNPYLRVLRSQLEKYITEQSGSKQLETAKTQTELRKLNKEIGALKKKLIALQIRKAEIEKSTSKQRIEPAYSSGRAK